MGCGEETEHKARIALVSTLSFVLNEVGSKLRGIQFEE